MPSLQRRAVAAVAPRVAGIVTEQLDGWSPGATIDLGQEMRALSLRVSSEVLFGISERERAGALGALLGDFMRRSFSTGVLVTSAYGRIPGSPYDRLHRHAERIESAVAALIEQRRGALGDDVISAMVRARDSGVDWLLEEDLVGQVSLLFGASYETTAQALVWTVLLLAQHPEVASELRAELEMAGPDPAFDALDALPLLDGVVRESLRLFPPVPYTIRIATRDADILGAAVRRGDRVLCSHFFTHRIEESFPQPRHFLPGRWKSAEPDAFEYVPFSAAPRICIGAGFSTAVVKRAIGQLVLRSDFRLPDRTRIDTAVRVTLGTRARVPLKLAAPRGDFRRATVRGDFAHFLALD